MLAGIGAAATTAEKSKELLDDMVEKGELTVEQGKALNEELKHNIKKTVKENVNVISETDFSENWTNYWKDDAGTDRSVEGETECYGRRTI